MKLKKIKIGMVGLGTVGAGVWQILQKHKSLISERVGIPLEITQVVVRSKRKARSVNIPSGKLLTDVKNLLADPEVSVILELTGDVRLSRRLALQSFAAGKHFVTANKALIAEHGAELFASARAHQVDICFEAAVGGGIPILRALREGFVGNEICSMEGILNGTCNYILSEMATHGQDFASVLKQAQALGYAEANPRFDVDGIDAAHKLAILVAIAYGKFVSLKDIYVEGIRRITPLDLEFARRFGYEIKLLGIAKKVGGEIQARVHPTMLSKESMLAAVQGVFNSVLIEGDFVGPQLLYGQGAGAAPTASAVVGDLVEVARNLLVDTAYTVPPLGTQISKIRTAKIQPIGRLKTPYYLRFQTTDKAGVLAKIAKILSTHGIGISSVYQHGQKEGSEVPIVILTHEAVEKNAQRAIAKIDRLAEIRRKTMLIRMDKTTSDKRK